MRIVTRRGRKLLVASVGVAAASFVALAVDGCDEAPVGNLAMDCGSGSDGCFFPTDAQYGLPDGGADGIPESSTDAPKAG